MRYAILILLTGCNLPIDLGALMSESEPIVYVVDAGIDASLAEAGWTLEGQDGTDLTGHGTLVARVIREVRPDARIVSVKVYKHLSPASAGTHADWCANAVRWIASQPAGVVLIEAVVLEPIGPAYMDALSDLDMPIVAPAGNRGIDACATGYVPQTTMPSVIVVGASDGEAYSNHGVCVDALARGKWFGKQGTSLAAAAYAARL